MKHKKITVEEHFSTIEHLDKLRAIFDKSYPVQEVIDEEKCILSDAPFVSNTNSPFFSEIIKNLLDVDEGRIAQMNACGIDMQVLSFVAPGVQIFDTDTAVKMAKNVNDKLSQIIKEHPSRFAGLAALALQNPPEAADELERSVTELGLKGACIFPHTKGEYPDDKKYRVVFERAHTLGVPIYLHPRGLPSNMIDSYADYPFLDSPILGFAALTSLAAIRLICSGIFDEYPDLKIILGHMGEAIPYWLWRIDNFWKKGPLAEKCQKTPSQYFKNNFVVTTSGMFHEPVLKFTLSVLNPENIMFATDYPMESTAEAVKFMEESSISEDDKKKICYRNAERVFSLTS